MKHHIKKILLAVGILALLVSACDTEPQDTVDPAGAPGAEPPPGAPIEARPTPTPKGNVGDAEQVTTDEARPTPTPAGSGDAEQPTTEEGGQADQAAPSAEEPVSGAEPEDVPSEEERNAILEGVNLAPPLPPGRDEEVEGPEPGTESGMGSE
jgi:hypothetical protein